MKALKRVFQPSRCAAPLAATLAVLLLIGGLAAAQVPPNDSIYTPTEITTLPLHDFLNVSEATWTDDEPYWYYPPANSVWYKLAPTSDFEVVVDTFPNDLGFSDFDTTLTAFEGTPGNMWGIAGNDDTNGLQSRIQFWAYAGRTYYIMAASLGYGNNLAFNVTRKTISLSMPYSIEAYCSTAPDGVVTITGSATHAEGAPMTATWSVDGRQIGEPVDVMDGVLELVHPFSIGNHYVIVAVTDGITTETAYTYVNVYDDYPAKVTATLATPRLPADNKMRDVGLRTRVETCPIPFHADGVPPDGAVRSIMEMGTYQLGAYTGANAIQLGYSDTITVPVPPGAYERFGFLSAASYAWDCDGLSALVNYSDGTSDLNFGSVAAGDWEYSYCWPAALSGMDFAWWNGTRWEWRDNNYKKIYESSILANPEKTVESLTLGGGNLSMAEVRASVFAMNAKPAGGDPVSVDLSGLYNTDVFVATPDLSGDPGGYFDQANGLNYLVDGNMPDATASLTIRVYSDESDTAGGGSINSPDAKVLAGGGLKLRGEYMKGSDGRVYLIVVEATTVFGRYAVGYATAVVPISSRKAAIDIVNYQAEQALSYIKSHSGMVPPGFVTVGDGPVIGKSQ